MLSTTTHRAAGRRPRAHALCASRAALALALCAPASLAVPPGGDAFAQGTRAVPGRVVSRHADWTVVCDTPPGAAREQCGATQSVVSEERPDLGLDVTVFETADRAARILRVIAPLGVFLPAGLGLNLDGEDLGRAVFTRCVAAGCEANVVMDDTLLSRLRAGTSAAFIIYQTPESGTGFPVDLDGLDEAYAALEAKRGGADVDAGGDENASDGDGPAAESAGDDTASDR